MIMRSRIQTPWILQTLLNKVETDTTVKKYLTTQAPHLPSFICSVFLILRDNLYQNNKPKGSSVFSQLRPREVDFSILRMETNK